MEPRLAGRTHGHPPVLVRRRIRRRELPDDDRDVCARLVGRDTRLEPAFREQPALAAAIEPRRARRRRNVFVHAGRLHVFDEARRNPELGGEERHEAGEGAVDDADDRKRLSADPKRLPDHARIAAELPLPVAVGQDDTARRGRVIVRAGERAAQMRRHPQHREVVAGDDFADQKLGAIAPGHRRKHRRMAGDVVEHRGRCAQVVQIGQRHRRVDVAVGAAHVEIDQSIGRGHRQGPQQQRVGYREDRRVEADAEGERSDRHGGKPRPLDQPSQRVTDVLNHRDLRRQQLLRKFGDDSVVGIDHVGDPHFAGLRCDLKRVHLVEAVIGDQPLDELDVRDAQRVDQRAHAGRHHDVLAVFDARPPDALAFDEIEPERDVHRRLEARADDLAVALQRMAVPEIEERTGVEDRQIDGHALADVRRIQIAAEVTRPESAKGFLSRRGDGDAPEHRLERDLDALAGRRGEIEDADHPLPVEPPGKRSRRQRVVEYSRPVVSGDAADSVRAVPGDGRVPVRRQFDEADDERVARRGALDVKRPHFTGPRPALVVVAGPRERLGHDGRPGRHAQHGLAHGVSRNAGGRDERD